MLMVGNFSNTGRNLQTEDADELKDWNRSNSRGNNKAIVEELQVEAFGG